MLTDTSIIFQDLRRSILRLNIKSIEKNYCQVMFAENSHVHTFFKEAQNTFPTVEIGLSQRKQKVVESQIIETRKKDKVCHFFDGMNVINSHHYINKKKLYRKIINI